MFAKWVKFLKFLLSLSLHVSWHKRPKCVSAFSLQSDLDFASLWFAYRLYKFRKKIYIRRVGTGWSSCLWDICRQTQRVAGERKHDLHPHQPNQFHFEIRSAVGICGLLFRIFQSRQIILMIWHSEQSTKLT